MTSLHVSAIDPERLEAIRHRGEDEAGNALTPFPADGWEPLRCCLALAGAGDRILLISYSPFTVASPWAETGPVFVHAEACPGYRTSDELPGALRRGPRVLRPYHEDGSLDYADITVVDAGDDIEDHVLDLLHRPAVDTVHVRALGPQCFTYAVTRGS
jgi:hypothetical protein